MTNFQFCYKCVTYGPAEDLTTVLSKEKKKKIECWKAEQCKQIRIPTERFRKQEKFTIEKHQ